MLWRKILLAVAIFLVALELLLQLGAVIVSTVTVSTTAAMPTLTAGPSVVCLGDSYTAGIGATSPEQSYPAQLQLRLRELGHGDIKVVNGGCAGKDSAFMMRRLPGLLQPETKVLCLLMAFNDTWSRPAPVDVSEFDIAVDVGSTFEWRWRTGRLLALCFGFGDNSWHRTSEELGNPPPAASNGLGEHSLLDVEAGFALLEELGLVAADEPPPALAPLPTGELQRRIYEIERGLLAGDNQAALAKSAALVRDYPDSAPAHKTLAVAANAAGELRESHHCATGHGQRRAGPGRRQHLHRDRTALGDGLVGRAGGRLRARSVRRLPPRRAADLAPRRPVAAPAIRQHCTPLRRGHPTSGRRSSRQADGRRGAARR